MTIGAAALIGIVFGFLGGLIFCAILTAKWHRDGAAEEAEGDFREYAPDGNGFPRNPRDGDHHLNLKDEMFIYDAAKRHWVQQFNHIGMKQR
jgi:hypothetical protein